MKFTAEAAELLRGLKVVRGAVEKRNTLPILSNVKIAVGEEISLAATDLDIHISVPIEGTPIVEGSTTVSVETITAFMGKLPKVAQVTLEYEDGRVKVISGRSRCTLPTCPVEDFPELASPDKINHSFTMRSSDVRHLFGRSKFAMSNNEARFNLNGVYLHTVKRPDDTDEMRAVATDGHRLAMVQVDAALGSVGMTGVIIPCKTVNEMIKAAAGEHEIDVRVGDTKIIFEANGTTVSSKLIDGVFPDYERVIPVENDKVAVINLADIVSAVGRVSSVSTDKGRGIRFGFDSDNLSISISNVDTGSAEDDLSVGYSSDPVAIGFSSRYLSDMINELEGEKIEVLLKDNGHPVIFRNEADHSATFVLMPMRV